MLASADTEAEVVEQLKRDEYFKSGIWNWSKVQILPVCPASEPVNDLSDHGGVRFKTGADAFRSSEVRFGRSCERRSLQELAEDSA